MSIDEIITRAGGARAIARASKGSVRPVGHWAVYQWRRHGITHIHWPLLMQLVPGLTPTEIFDANMELMARPGPGRDTDACASV